jgi:hypothetical protein
MTMLPIKDADEIKTIIFQFVNEMGSTETISDAEVTVVLVAGTDAVPNDVLDGAVTLNQTTKEVWQNVKGGVENANYQLRCLVTSSLGLKHLVVGTLPVRNLE